MVLRASTSLTGIPNAPSSRPLWLAFTMTCVTKGVIPVRDISAVVRAHRGQSACKIVPHRSDILDCLGSQVKIHRDVPPQSSAGTDRNPERNPIVQTARPWSSAISLNCWVHLSDSPFAPANNSSSVNSAPSATSDGEGHSSST
jgi:hypothetical protein